MTKWKMSKREAKRLRAKTISRERKKRKTEKTAA
jgi:hypothetical protein